MLRTAVLGREKHASPAFGVRGMAPCNEEFPWHRDRLPLFLFPNG